MVLVFINKILLKEVGWFLNGYEMVITGVKLIIFCSKAIGVIVYVVYRVYKVTRVTKVKLQTE